MAGYRVTEVGRLKLLALSRERVEAINSLRQQLKATQNQVTYWHLVWMLLFSTTTRMFVALRENEIVGIALLVSSKLLVGRRDSLEELVVHDAHRGRGVGDLLVTRVVDESRKQGAELIDLTVEDSNQAAQNLYKRHGFEPLDDRSTMRCKF